MRAYHVAVGGFNFKLMTYQKVISAPFNCSMSVNFLARKMFLHILDHRKPNLPKRTYQTKPTNQAYQIKPTKPNLPNLYLTKPNLQNKPTKPNLQNQNS